MLWHIGKGEVQIVLRTSQEISSGTSEKRRVYSQINRRRLYRLCTKYPMATFGESLEFENIHFELLTKCSEYLVNEKRQNDD